MFADNKLRRKNLQPPVLGQPTPLPHQPCPPIWFPSVFITISPFEGTFPFPPWLNNLRNETGKGPTELAIPETIHIAHVLEPYIRGYLCCSNTNSWKNHLFIKNSDPCEQREQLLLQVRSPEEGYTPRAYSHMAQGHERHGCDQAVGNNTTGKH